MTEVQFIHYLATKIEREGGRAKFALAHGVSQAHLSNVLTGKRAPSETLLSSMDLERIIFICPKLSV